MRPALLLAILAALAGCSEQSGEVPRIDDDNPLEAAARDANLVVDPAETPPTGLYELVHSSGTDAICVVPASGDRYRFGLIASFGSTLMCEGRGDARHSGNTLTLDFDEAECSFAASYDGQSLVLPGQVPEGCSRLCGPRASMSGVSVSRVDWEESGARRLRSRSDGAPLCGT